jgi:hypothetical protein
LERDKWKKIVEKAKTVEPRTNITNFSTATKKKLTCFGNGLLARIDKKI